MKYKLVVKNIQAIEYAEIEIDSITGIVGNNNLGKSTINKILFSLVKTKIDLENLNGRNFLKEMVSNHFEGDGKDDSVNRVLRYIYDRNSDGLTDFEMIIAKNIKELASGMDLVPAGISKHLLSELSSPILRFGSKKGEIKLYKKNKLIYELELTDNEDIFDKRLGTGEVKLKENYNKLLEFEYNDVTYLELNDLLTMNPVWGEILVSNRIKESTKDTIRKLMKCNTINIKGEVEGI